MALLTAPQLAAAAAPPTIAATWVTDVTATSANLRARISPEGVSASYRFEYLTEAAFEHNLAEGREGFAGAARAPSAGSAPLGSGSEAVAVVQHVGGLTPVTTYRYRVFAISAAGTTLGVPRSLGTEAPTNAFVPLDHRGYELVSPVDKGGGAVAAPGALFGGGDLQAAADGEAVTYGSSSSFAGSAGAPGADQYLSRRGAEGWQTGNITTPTVSGAYGDQPDGTPYRLFSTGLGSALLLNGRRCRGEEGECPVANPPLPGSGAPAGYQDYYLRENATGGFRSLLGAAELTHTSLAASQFSLALAGATPSLSHVVLSSCAALSANATEAATPGDCDDAAENLYSWTAGGGLTLVNLRPGQSTGTPGAALAAPAGAIPENGARVYWTDPAGGLYLYEAGTGKAVDESGAAEFQLASADGAVAYFLAAGHLYRYLAPGGSTTDITPGGGVLGVLGSAADGSTVYYATGAGLFKWRGGITTEVAGGAVSPSDYPPATATARVSADGNHLLFASGGEPTGYESFGLEELFLYGPPPGGGEPRLVCVSCNPTGERPQGGASIPGALVNGTTTIYKPRVLSADGERVFFDSEDALSVQDTDDRPDVYEWEAAGEGTCDRTPGCVQLISSGRSPEASTFVDASADGSDAFFLTGESLVPSDPGSIDLYDARDGGGFPFPPTPIPCNGDACQPLPEAPEDPTPGTLVPNSGNPPLRFPKAKGKRKRHRHKKHHGKHHRRKHHQRTHKGKGR
ncbi:MAG TPA: hypothetical protein VFK14_11705 [Solirubrobacterales bacterium]|nr:hypothetical protein [Solirubrobacterales bacterium]